MFIFKKYGAFKFDKYKKEINEQIGSSLCNSINRKYNVVQSNFNSSNTDGLFTMANSNSFLSPYEILPLAQENKYLGKFSYFIMKSYIVCTH